MKLYMTEHDANRTWPALNTQTVDEGKISNPLIPLTRSLRLHADDDCLIAVSDRSAPTEVELAWTRLAADITEWFDVPKDPRNVRVWVRAEE